MSGPTEIGDGPLAAAEFAALLRPLGPFEPRPRLAVAVSGGADSLALALLSDAWARERGGGALALIVDHGLRPASAREAMGTATKLAARQIPSRLLTGPGLAAGPARAARARSYRYALLRDACRRDGIPHLLLAHHVADQAETIIMRALSGSGPAGLAGMPALTEETNLRLLRPLLMVPPMRLRATVAAAGLDWVEDPSNVDPSALRARLRELRADRDGGGAATAALAVAGRALGLARAEQDAEIAALFAERIVFRPEGFALLPAEPMPPAALRALVAAVAGSAFPPATSSLTALAAAPRPATLGRVRLLQAGRLGDGLLMVREDRFVAPPVPARPGAVWDRRFRLLSRVAPEMAYPPGAMLGALGDDAAKLRRLSPLPAAVLRVMPAVRQDQRLIAVPHLGWSDPDRADAADRTSCPILFCPPHPACGAPFQPALVE